METPPLPNAKEIPKFNEFEELYTFLRSQNESFISDLTKNIDMTDGSEPTVHDLIFLIEKIENGEYPLEALTQEKGLREVVYNILHTRETRSETRSRDLLANLHSEFETRTDTDTDDYKAEQIAVTQHKQKIQDSLEKLKALTNESSEPSIITTPEKLPAATQNFKQEQASLTEERHTRFYKMFNKVKNLFRKK